MSIITYINREPETISKESPKESEYGDNPKEWPKGTVCVAGDSILNRMDEKLLSRKRIVNVTPFSEAVISNMYDLLKPVLKRNPDYIILHNGANYATRNTANELLDKILALKSFVTRNNKNCKAIISTITMRVDDQQCGSVVNGVNEFLKELNIPIVNNKKHY